MTFNKRVEYGGFRQRKGAADACSDQEFRHPSGEERSRVPRFDPDAMRAGDARVYSVGVMEDRTRRSLDHAVKFFQELAEEASASAEAGDIPRMIGYDRGRTDTYRTVADYIESILRDEDELNGLVPPRSECQVCNGLGREAGRACDACMGRGFFSPSGEVADNERAPL